ARLPPRHRRGVHRGARDLPLRHRAPLHPAIREPGQLSPIRAGVSEDTGGHDRSGAALATRATVVPVLSGGARRARGMYDLATRAAVVPVLSGARRTRHPDWKAEVTAG